MRLTFNKTSYGLPLVGAVSNIKNREDRKNGLARRPTTTTDSGKCVQDRKQWKAFVHAV